MKKYIGILLLFLSVVVVAQPPSTNRTGYWQESDGITWDSDSTGYILLAVGDTIKIIESIDTLRLRYNTETMRLDSFERNYIDRKSPEKLVYDFNGDASIDTVPANVLFSNYNYDSLVYVQISDTTLYSDLKQEYPERITEVATYSTPTAGVDDYFNVPSIASTGVIWVDKNGGYDYTSLDTAVRINAAPGDTIYVRHGLYDEDTPTYDYLRWQKDDYTLIGVGHTKIRTSGTTYLLYLRSGTIDDRIRLHNIHLDGEGTSKQLTHFFALSGDIVNCYYDDYTGTASSTNGGVVVRKNKRNVFTNGGYGTLENDTLDNNLIIGQLTVSLYSSNLVVDYNRIFRTNSSHTQSINISGSSTRNNDVSARYNLIHSVGEGIRLSTIPSTNDTITATIHGNTIILDSLYEDVGLRSSMNLSPTRVGGSAFTRLMISDNHMYIDVQDEESNTNITTGGNFILSFDVTDNYMSIWRPQGTVDGNGIYLGTGDTVEYINILRNKVKTNSLHGVGCCSGESGEQFRLDMTVEENEIEGYLFDHPGGYDNLPTYHGMLVRSADHLVRYNKIKEVELGIVPKTGPTDSTSYVYNNIVHDTRNVPFYARRSVNLKVWNNIFANDSTSKFMNNDIQGLSTAGTNVEFRNNIWYSPNDSVFFDIDSIILANGLTFQNEIIYHPDSSAAVTYRNSGTQFSLLQAQDSGWFSSNIYRDPLFNDYSNRQLWPGSDSSPAYNAGVNVGLSNGLNTNSTWPDGVNTQTIIDSPEIGAYELDFAEPIPSRRPYIIGGKPVIINGKTTITP